MAVTAASKRLSNLGEGPHWDPISQKLYHVDAFVGDVCCFNPDTGETDVLNFGGTVTVSIPFVHNPRCLLVTKGKEVYSLEFDTKSSSLIAVVDNENPKSRFNDGKCDSKGHFWGGTVIEDGSGPGKLWLLDSVGPVFSPFVENVTFSNGLTWSLDNKTLYYVDSGEKTISAFDFDAEIPKAGNQKVLVDFKKNEECSNLGVPDGMTIDIDGKLWVACFGGGCIIQVDPLNGKILQKVKIPAKETTSCCFGGPNFDILFVTSSFRGLNKEEKIAEPESGAIFAVSGLGTKGLPLHCYKGLN